MTAPFIQFEIAKSFRVRTARGFGTAFLYRNTKGTAFLSAGHNLDGCQIGEKIFIQHQAGWREKTITDIKTAPNMDACAFCIDQFFIDSDLKTPAQLSVTLGDELRFLGFPHDLENTHPGVGFTTPLMRGAIFSGVINVPGGTLSILDGFNNPGYSGAPIYAAAGPRMATLFGLVSGYKFERPDHGRIMRQLPGGTEEPVPDLYARTNSGMIQAVQRGVLDVLIDSLDEYLPVMPSPSR